MMRLVFFAALVLIAWYGWHHYHDLITRRPNHEAVVENHSGRQMDGVRLTVGGKTFVKEHLPDESSVSFPFRVSEDASFLLEWKWSTSDMELHWTGGTVPHGPMVQRHTMSVDGDGAVMYRAENKLSP